MRRTSDGYELILASASPRRAELLRAAGYAFRVVVPTIPEPHSGQGDATPAGEAEALSYFKARTVADGLSQGLVLGADTIVAFDGRIYGKPRDRSHAEQILSTLMGTTHQVITGVTLLDAADGRRTITHDSTEVTMRCLSAAELTDYLDSSDWEGKAGAYGIQDDSDPFVGSIEGSFSNVMGLPMELLAEMLSAFSILHSRASNFTA